ncbi:hypothetical protein ABW21_db0205034 [Orbilia brochopaga]|nr:hypothetical protein ABW21_db0205034 [Drechslerella brochopaga]
MSTNGMQLTHDPGSQTKRRTQSVCFIAGTRAFTENERLVKAFSSTDKAALPVLQLNDQLTSYSSNFPEGVRSSAGVCLTRKCLLYHSTFAITKLDIGQRGKSIRLSGDCLPIHRKKARQGRYTDNVDLYFTLF